MRVGKVGAFTVGRWCFVCGSSSVQRGSKTVVGQWRKVRVLPPCSEKATSPVHQEPPTESSLHNKAVRACACSKRRKTCLLKSLEMLTPSTENILE